MHISFLKLLNVQGFKQSLSNLRCDELPFVTVLGK